MEIKSIYIFLFITIFLSCKKESKSELHKLLTNDSISLWDYEKYFDNDTSYFSNGSISFDSSLNCDLYNKLISGKRLVLAIGPEPDSDGVCDKWSIINDSTINVNCRFFYTVRKITNDSLILIDTLENRKLILVRVKSNWDIDEESLIEKKERIKTGKYLNNNNKGYIIENIDIIRE